MAIATPDRPALVDLWRQAGGGSAAFDADLYAALSRDHGWLLPRKGLTDITRAALATSGLGSAIDSAERLAHELVEELGRNGWRIHDVRSCIRLPAADGRQWREGEALQVGGPELAAQVALSDVVDALNAGTMSVPSEHPAWPETASAGDPPAADGARAVPPPASMPEPAASPPGGAAPAPKHPRPRRRGGAAS